MAWIEGIPPSFNGQAEDKIAKARKEDVSDTPVLMTSDNGFWGGLASLGQTDDINIVYRNERGSRKEAGPEGDASRSFA